MPDGPDEGLGFRFTYTRESRLNSSPNFRKIGNKANIQDTLGIPVGLRVWGLGAQLLLMLKPGGISSR